MASASPYALYIKFLKVPAKSYVSKAEWDKTNCHCIDGILQHVSTWTNASKKAPRIAVAHELCALKGMHMNIKAGRLRMMQALIPALMTEINKYDNEYELPVPTTNVARTLMTRPEAVIVAPVGSKNVPADEFKLLPHMNSASGQTKQVDSPYMPTKRRRERAEEVGSMIFKTVEEYKHFLQVGKHVVHSSPCVQMTQVKLGHCLTCEQWVPTKGQVDTAAGSTWEFRCRRRRKTSVKKSKAARRVIPKAVAGRVHVLPS